MTSWDEAKRASNLAKHGVDFADLGGFAWDEALIEPDGRRDYGETRWVAVGPVGPRLHVIVFTKRAGERRIISARKANNREIDRYVSATDPADA
jgi:uncharacterized DUF497 family protein